MVTTIYTMRERDQFFMDQALSEAEKAFALGEVPIGAVVVDSNDIIIGRGFNQVEQFHSQRYHAEAIALEQAGKKKLNWRLEDCRLYVTLEPCSMCMNFVLLSRLPELIFALQSPRYGFKLDRYNSFELYKGPMVVREGVCETKAHSLLQSFFKTRREVCL
jgi:tRNA(adenine34) deaminase